MFIKYFTEKMQTKFLYFIFICDLVAPGISTHPNAGLSIVELVTKYGYPIESHKVQTEDGYILTMHRIPHGINNNNTQNKPNVLLMHAFLCSSVDWVNMGPKKALGFLLADSGYDVWIGNQRGNTWSRKHVILDPDLNKTQFFNWSWHEIGIYDLPAKIDYILDVTKQKKLFYIGHSQGTTAFFTMAAEKPEYNKKIKLMTAFAPVTFLSNIPNPFLKISSYLPLNEIVEIFKIHEFMPHSWILTELGATVCSSESPLKEFCALLIFCFAGFDRPQLDTDFIPVITTNAPAGSSARSYLHFMQAITSGNFSQYDYGVEKNLKVYGQNNPPHYDLSKVTAPISLRYGQNDWLSSLLDIEKLAQSLPNLVSSKIVPFAEFNHLDFIWANDVVELLYNDVIADIEAIK